MEPGRILALIPAKARSTRLPRKNLIELGGRSLVARAIDCARGAGFAEVIVSTEDEEVAAESRRAGAQVPFLRPEKLAVDPAGVADVTLFMLDELEKRGSIYDTVAILLPTSPFRTSADCTNAVAAYRNSDAAFLMSVSRYDHTPLAALVLNDGYLSPLHPEWINRLGAKADKPIPALVRANGAIVICNVAAMREERTYYAYPLAAYEMPWQRSVDIDTEEDVRLAEYLISAKVVD